jgi:hypothetical protein
LNQITTLQVLFVSLIIGVLFAIAILIGYPALWLIRRSRQKGKAAKSEVWLEDETKDTHLDKSKAIQMSIVTNIKSASLRRKILAVALVFMLFFMSFWVSWELSSNGYVDSNVYNTDKRVFSEAHVEENATCLCVIGAHDLTLDTRWCVLESFSVPFAPQVDCYPNITARWNLSCQLSASILGYATVEIRYLLSDFEGCSLYDVLVFNLTASGNEIEFNKIQEKSGVSEMKCFEDYTYLISVILRVILSGFSSVEGLDPGTPLSLIIEEIRISENT